MAQATTQSVLIAGAGIAGLAAALACARAGFGVTVLDRDPPPPDVSAEDAFFGWERKGVAQLRHSHVFLGRLTTLIRAAYPDLLETLKRAGARELGLAEAAPLSLRRSIAERPGDEDLAFLFSRRTTLELAIRRYAQSAAGIRFVTGVAVRGIACECAPGGALAVRGLEVEAEGERRTMTADVVVDAAGRNTMFPEWLRAAGAAVAEDEAACGILYFTRHYRLREGQAEPERTREPGAGDLGYVKYGVFAADNRCFSITLAVPEIETELRAAVMRPEAFDRICALIPGAGRWTDPSRAEAISKVFAMGNLRSLWRDYADGDAPSVMNFFAVGDSAVRTNPLYGRGCTAAFIAADILARVLRDGTDPAARAQAYRVRLRAELRPFYDVMARQDAQAIRRALAERTPGRKPRMKARIVKSFVEDAIGPATRGDAAVYRAFMRGFHMLEPPAAWLKRPAILARVLAFWAAPRPLKRRYYPPVLGPARADMLRALGLAA